MRAMMRPMTDAGSEGISAAVFHCLVFVINMHAQSIKVLPQVLNYIILSVFDVFSCIVQAQEQPKVWLIQV